TGLGSAWRLAHEVWNPPAVVGEVLMLVAAIVWASLIVFFALKWFFARAESSSELDHPVQCCFIGLIGVATMLVAGGVLRYDRTVAEVLFTAGGIFTLVFAVWRTGGLWQGERNILNTTAVLYLPTVAGCFVTAIATATLGYRDWGQLAFGAGIFAWLAIESVLLHRLLTASQLSEPLRPTLGIQLAPPAVGALAYLNVTQGPPDLFSHMLIGYALLQACVLVRLLPWIWRGAFSVSWWAFTFGATALSAASLKLIQRGDSGAVAHLAPYIFVAVNVAVGLIILGTLWLAARGRLLGVARQVPPPAPGATGAAPTDRNPAMGAEAQRPG
ncbi:MAG TPA: dicarboxylate transporter/tellurite-resistance protein TehA, partial [Steroidobacteraceae bacterium]|nr:dicarboxylate transporter/tellurite-resistance protein TehA [Steroidobacteraceae bacterium]